MFLQCLLQNKIYGRQTAVLSLLTVLKPKVYYEACECERHFNFFIRLLLPHNHYKKCITFYDHIQTNILYSVYCHKVKYTHDMFAGVRTAHTMV